MKWILILLAVLATMTTGCIHGPAMLTTARIKFERVTINGTNRVELVQPKDVSIGEFTISPDGTVTLRKYSSAANAAAIAANVEMDAARNRVVSDTIGLAQDAVSVAAKVTGTPIPVRPKPPQ
jgi:hypothetical protein